MQCDLERFEQKRYNYFKNSDYYWIEKNKKQVDKTVEKRILVWMHWKLEK